jgi:hypothetical protein
MDDRRGDKSSTVTRKQGSPAESERMLPDFQLPPGCTKKHGSYYLIRQNRWERLTRISDGAIAFWRAYYRLTAADPNTMAGIMLAFLEKGLGEITADTAKKYEAAVVTRLIPYCGHIHKDDFNSSHVARYLEARKQAKAAIAGNRERAALSSAINFAMRQGWMVENPCHGVRRNKERPSRRYVEHDELAGGIDKANEPLQDLISAAYLTGMRQTDLRLLRQDQVRDGWIHVDESKTGKKRSHEITPTLAIFVNRAIARAKAIGSELVFTSPKGLPWSVWGLQSAMRRLKAGFRFRDLRPKAESDKPGTLGHVGQMKGRYTRREKLRAVK